MLKKIGIPILALAAILAFVAPTHANAAVRFGVAVGPVYTYPAPYPYPYAYSYPYGYYNPYYPYAYSYPYPYGFYGGGYYWGGGHRDFDRHERGGHEFRGRGFGGGFRGGERGSRGGHRR
jgi:hypothetical protein